MGLQRQDVCLQNKFSNLGPYSVFFFTVFLFSELIVVELVVKKDVC